MYIKISEAEVVKTRKTIKMRVESETAKGVYNRRTEMKLKRIRELIKTGEYKDQVNLEGGTGFLKLQNILSMDRRQSMEFGFINKNTFFVEVSMILVYPADISGIFS